MRNSRNGTENDGANAAHEGTTVPLDGRNETLESNRNADRRNTAHDTVINTMINTAIDPTDRRPERGNNTAIDETLISFDVAATQAQGCDAFGFAGRRVRCATNLELAPIFAVETHVLRQSGDRARPSDRMCAPARPHSADTSGTFVRHPYRLTNRETRSCDTLSPSTPFGQPPHDSAGLWARFCSNPARRSAAPRTRRRCHGARQGQR